MNLSKCASNSALLPRIKILDVFKTGIGTEQVRLRTTYLVI